MSQAAAVEKRSHEDSMPEPTPIAKRQKSDGGSVVAPNDDVEMKDVTIREEKGQGTEGHAGAMAENAGSGKEEEVGAGPSDKKTKKSDSSRPRRNKKKDRPEGEKKPARVRRRATKEEEEAAKERKAQKEAQGISTLRYPKRQSALLIGFCGSGYSGMQMCVVSADVHLQNLLDSMNFVLDKPVNRMASRRLRGLYSMR